jgi:class 3 adenylate cyclase
MHEPHGQPVTILFTDVQGSTQLRARHGDRVADEILHGYRELGLWRHAEDAAVLPDPDGERGRHA